MKETKNTYSYEDTDFFERFPKRIEDSHKGTYGKVGIIAGSKGMAGAAFLSARAAYAVGAGLVQIYTHEDNRIILQQLLPEAIVVTYRKFDKKQLMQFVKSSDVLVIGCGMGQESLSLQCVRYVLQNAKCPCVLDADALNMIAKDFALIENKMQPLILTPHMKEMARLLNCSVEELKNHRLEYLKAFAEKHHLTCVLKDAKTSIYSEGSGMCLNQTGNSAMSKGGSGDVLAGIIGGILAQDTPPHEAACLGVYLHGKSGDIARERFGAYSVLARDLIDCISEVLKQI